MQHKALITTTAVLLLAIACGDDKGDNNDAGGGTDDDSDEGTDDSGDDGSATQSGDNSSDDEGSSDGGETEEVDPDSDGDGLPDAEEEEIGTDPNKKDTDDDTYWDPWEIWEGTDPLDKESRIYTGYWPYNPNKDDLHQGTWEESGKQKGDPFPRMALVDQHGEELDIYDLSQYGKNEDEGHPGAWLIIDISAVWCGPCNDVARWIADNAGPLAAELEAEFPTIRDKIHDDIFLWVTTLYEDANLEQADAGDVAAWAATFDDPWIPVLVDDEKRIRNRYAKDSFPFFFLVHPEMKMEFLPQSGDGYDTLRAIEENWPPG